VRIQGRRATADAAARSGRGQSFEGAFHDEFAEELVEGSEHVELQTPEVSPDVRTLEMGDSSLPGLTTKMTRAV
jgi:hypothetical protein